MQSEGEGERSRLVTGAWSPRAGPNAEPPRCAPPSPSPDMPFSDRNSSKSAYCNTRESTHHDARGRAGAVAALSALESLTRPLASVSVLNTISNTAQIKIEHLHSLCVYSLGYKVQHFALYKLKNKTNYKQHSNALKAKVPEGTKGSEVLQGWAS